ncbi:protein NRT1/ PTR FAMILY 4.3-like isoform X3 [Brassica napus]|uniref:protein NRT1/ PTR FAMILY 4.3-like isoform X3 n=1 Tax=Brassica napus TaxID=3708 RepID=UPI000BBEE000|nr:protein NRT1/ PTR FAMILY 4.3-like isoform X3 [Brassica napus]
MEKGNKESKKWVQEEVSNEINNRELAEEESVDWRGRPSNPSKHGGMRAALFVLGLQAFEIMGIAAVGNNLITYVINEMHFPLSKAANIVTNFVGTIFIFSFVELSGFILLSVQAHLSQLKPPKCNPLINQSSCEEAKGFKAIIFFTALYLVALGSGCVKPNMIAHGADQFSHQSHPKQSKRLSSYFNAAYFAFSIGELIALSLLVWIQTHSGMDVGFGVSAAAMTMGLISLVSGTTYFRNKRPRRSIFPPIAQEDEWPYKDETLRQAVCKFNGKSWKKIVRQMLFFGVYP